MNFFFFFSMYVWNTIICRELWIGFLLVWIYFVLSFFFSLLTFTFCGIYKFFSFIKFHDDYDERETERERERERERRGWPLSHSIVAKLQPTLLIWTATIPTYYTVRFGTLLSSLVLPSHILLINTIFSFNYFKKQKTKKQDDDLRKNCFIH